LFETRLAQITTTSQDASFNRVNLLGGDQLKLTFNETGKSILNITGVPDRRHSSQPVLTIFKGTVCMKVEQL
jgi:hypothetical protein